MSIYIDWFDAKSLKNYKMYYKASRLKETSRKLKNNSNI